MGFLKGEKVIETLKPIPTTIFLIAHILINTRTMPLLKLRSLYHVQLVLSHYRKKMELEGG